jgi:site-specific DNA-cytosine methylase
MFCVQTNLLRRSSLYVELLRMADEVGASAMFLENVSALVGKNMRSEMMIVLDSITDRGFDVTWTVVSAKQCGAPMLRPRIFILAIRRGARAKILDKMRKAVPPPTDLNSWRATIAQKWNPEAGCPPMIDWLLERKPVDFTARLTMLGNCVSGWS